VTPSARGSWAAIGAVLIGLCSGGCLSRATAQEVAEWRVRPAPEVEIGKSSGDEAYLFQAIQSADLLPDGRIVVADAGLSVIRVYGRDGTFQREFGGSGEGPGEFRGIDRSWLTPDGRIGVWDKRSRRITILDPDSGLVATHRVEPPSSTPLATGNLEVLMGTFGDGDLLLASLTRRGTTVGPDLVADTWFLGRFGSSGEFERHLGEVPGMHRFDGRVIPFSPLPHAVVYRDTLYVTNGYEAEITVRSPEGVRVRTIRLPRRESGEDADETWASLERKLRARKGPVARLSLREIEDGRVPRTERFPQLGDLIVDDRGYLWAKVYELPDDAVVLGRHNALWPDPGGRWRVVRPDGSVVAAVRIPDGVRPYRVRGDRLLGLALDELNVHRVVIHRVERDHRAGG